MGRWLTIIEVHPNDNTSRIRESRSDASFEENCFGDDRAPAADDEGNSDDDVDSDVGSAAGKDRKLCREDRMFFGNTVVSSPSGTC